MHLIATETATLDEAGTAIDLAHSPAEFVVLSFSDSDLSALAAAWTANRERLPTLRLASLKQLRHPMSVDLYVERVVQHAKCVVVRCLGGLDYWRYGLERISEEARTRGFLFAALPGDDRADERLVGLSTVAREEYDRLDRYFRSGGVGNGGEVLRFAGTLIGRDGTWREPVDIGAIVGVGDDGQAVPVSALTATRDGRPVGLIVVYRANVLAADTAPVGALMRALDERGIAPVCVAVSSLKDAAVAEPLQRLIAARQPAIILNTTAFSAQREDGTTILDAADVPVMQVVLAGSSREAWSGSPRGLAPSDLAMNVVLPELDGRILSRAVSFKGEAPADAQLEYGAVRHEPEGERVAFVAEQAARWVRLAYKPRRRRQIAVILSDYPARAGRAGYAVGLDTAASAAEILRLLGEAGYDAGDGASAGDVEHLLNGSGGRVQRLVVPHSLHNRRLARLPQALRDEIVAAWGKPEEDPAACDKGFVFTVLRLGKVLIALQPDRGARSNRKSSYHDTSLPPRHAYVAFYTGLRETERVDAIVHLGTHGTLEWLPGKALALSSTCWPEAVLGPVPVVYPFIVNNPGEAVHAKRRLSAVTIGHLTPPLSQAGLHGPLAELEGLVEEYAAADGLDRRRIGLIEAEILERAWASGLAAELELKREMPAREAIGQLDARLCDIKELAVRDRLHVFGCAPDKDAGAALAEAIMAGSDRACSAAEIERLITASAASERAMLLAALDGRRVPPGPSGAPSRGRADVLPTGRNVTTIDPRAVPTRVAATIGQRAADEVVRRYVQDHGDYPRQLVIDLWAAASLRTGGDDLAQALAYLGVRPVWDGGSGRVTGIEVLPPAVLGRPRIDVTVRISGLFRDIFEAQIALIALAVQRVADLDEDDMDNPLAAARRRGEGLQRVFGGAPGSYGAQAAEAALDTAWTDRDELGRAYLAGGACAFDGGGEGAAAQDAFAARVAGADALIHPQDDRERDVLDGDGAADFAGGFAAAAAMLGNDVALYHLDTSSPDVPRVRSLAEETARVVRGKLANPRWVEGMLAHGHRGVAEIAQGVDALYALSATARIVPGHLFDLVHDRLVCDRATFEAMALANPAAAGAIVRRLDDALARGLWVARRNAVADELARARVEIAA